MSYEYQKDIKEAILEKYKKHPLNVFKRQGELDRVYAQAEKADEYEAKAKTFDAILTVYDEALSEGHMADDVCNIIEKFESGGSDD